VAEAEVAHCPDKHSLLHDAWPQQMHHCQANKRLNGKMYNLTINTSKHTQLQVIQALSPIYYKTESKELESVM